VGGVGPGSDGLVGEPLDVGGVRMCELDGGAAVASASCPIRASTSADRLLGGGVRVGARCCSVDLRSCSARAGARAPADASEHPFAELLPGATRE